MHKHDILALFDEQERKNSIHPAYRREESAGVVRNVSPDPTRRSFIIYSELTAANADQVIADQVRWYQQDVKGAGLEWKTYDHDQPAIKDRLLTHGFAAEEVEAMLILDLEQCPPVYLEPVTMDVRRITDTNMLSAITDIQAAAWGQPFDWLERMLRENLTTAPEFWSIYIAYVDNMPACAAWASYPQNSLFAGLWGGATVPQYRKMGVYTAVVATRAQEAIRRGYRYLMVDASDMSRPILEKRGFKLLTHTTPFFLSGPEKDS